MGMSAGIEKADMTTSDVFHAAYVAATNKLILHGEEIASRLEPQPEQCRYCHKRTAKTKTSLGHYICDSCLGPKPIRRRTGSKPPGRNDRCPCGSGRKWKVCCMRGVVD